MINSNQVAAMMAQQQQQQQMLGMGAPSVALGQSQYPPQYNFGNMGLMNNGLSGNTGIMGMAASGISGLGSAATTMAGVTSLAAGFGIGGATLGGMAGSLLGLNPLTLGLLAGGFGLKAVGGAASEGFRTNAQVGQFLSSANFANPSSSTGFGFNYNDQYRMTDTIIGMGASNPFVNQQDQMQLLNQFQQMGLDKGVTSMGKMIDKFKEFSKTTEEVATQLGKTVNEVTGYVGKLKGQGFYSAEEVTGMSRRYSAMAGYGMDAGQAADLSSNRAAMTRGQGMSGRAGALLSINTLENISAAAQSNFMDKKALFDLSGEENIPAAAAAFSNRVGAKFSSALVGGGSMEKLLAGFTKMDASGRMVIDSAAINDVVSGNMSSNDLLSRASTTIAGGGAGKFRGGKKRLASEFLQDERGMDAILSAVMSMSEDLSSSRDNLDLNDAFNIISQEHLGLAENEAELLYEYASNMKATRSKVLSNRANQMAAEERRAYISKHRSFAALKKHIGHNVDLLMKNPSIQRDAAKMSTEFDSMLAGFENYWYGTEVSTANLFTDNATNRVRSDFLSGKLDNMQFSGMDMTDPSNIYKARMQGFANATGSTKGRELFTNALTAGLGQDQIDKLRAIKVDEGRVRGFRHTTNYGEREQELFYFDSFDAQSYNYLMADTKRKIATSLGKPVSEVTDQEAHVAISNTEEGSAALQRYAKKDGLFMGETLKNDRKAAFLSKATVGDFEGAAGRFGGALAGAIKYGSLGAATGAAGGAAIGATALGAGAVPGAILGAKIFGTIGAVYGAVSGFLSAGDNEHARKLESGIGTKLLAKLNGTAKLKDFDKIFKEEFLNAGEDKEAAAVRTAERLTKKYGEDITPEDVLTALKSLEDMTGKDSIQRLASGDYKKALEITGAAEDYQQSEILVKHMDSMADALTGSGLEEADELRATLLSGNVAASREKMLDMARKMSTGEIDYSGNNAMLQELGKSNQVFDSMKHLVGKDISALDSMLGGKGQGEQYRRLAGIRSGSQAKISSQELKRISDLVVTNKAFQSVESAAGQDIASVTGGGDEATNNIVKATTNLLNSTDRLAVYVDNIASVVTGNEPYGQQLNMDKK